MKKYGRDIEIKMEELLIIKFDKSDYKNIEEIEELVKKLKLEYSYAGFE